LLVVEHQQKNIDWKELGLWVMSEGISGDKEIIEFFKKIDRQLPD